MTIGTKRVFTLSSSLLVIGVIVVLLLVHTISAYAGTCETLSGLPGILQAAGFVPRGGCPKPSSGVPCGGPCLVGGSGRAGTCTPKPPPHTGHSPKNCVCIPNKVSP